MGSAHKPIVIDQLDCAEVEDLLVDYVESAVEPRKIRLLEQHLMDCDSCERKLQQTRKLMAAFPSMTRTLDQTPVHRQPLSLLGDRDIWEIPDYERVQVCGSGAYGVVWAVRDRVGVFRALKVIDLARLRAANIECREFDALKAYCRLVQQHRNLIQVFHVGVLNDTLYYTMELADDLGTRKTVTNALPKDYEPLTLKSVIEQKRIPLNVAAGLVLRLLRGLATLHSAGLAHRDIKPANIVVVNKTLKLADIGMMTTNTIDPSHVGTPAYMPPDGKMDLTADTYALARIFYEMMIGPGQWSSFPALDHVADDPGLEWDTERLEQVLAKACSADAKDRFQHADELTEEMAACRTLSLDAILAGEMPQTLTSPPRPRPAYVPVLIATINTVPKILGLILLIIIAAKLL